LLSQEEEEEEEEEDWPRFILSAANVVWSLKLMQHVQVENPTQAWYSTIIVKLKSN